MLVPGLEPTCKAQVGKRDDSLCKSWASWVVVPDRAVTGEKRERERQSLDGG